MYNSERLYQEERKAGRNSLIGAVLLVLTALLLIVGVIHFSSVKRNAGHLNDIIFSSGDKEGKMAYIDADGFFQFATYGDDLGYYIAYDSDYYYIISIRENEVDSFIDQFDVNSYDTVRLWGFTEEIPLEAKSYAVESMNEEFGREVMTLYDFEDVFGDTALTVRKASFVRGLGGFFKVAWAETLASVTLLIIGLTLFVSGRSLKKSYDSFLDSGNRDADWFLEEADDPSAVLDEQAKLIFGPQSLILYNGKPQAAEYEDILWVYATQHRYNGIPDYSFLNICLKDGRTLMGGNRKTFGKKNSAAAEAAHNEAIDRIRTHNPEVLTGWSKENQEAYQRRIHGEI